MVTEPLAIMVWLIAVVATNFFVCILWDCDVGMQTGFNFVKEHIVPGTIVGFVLVLLWFLFGPGTPGQ